MELKLIGFEFELNSVLDALSIWLVLVLILVSFFLFAYIYNENKEEREKEMIDDLKILFKK